MIKAVSVAGLEKEGIPFKKPSVQLSEAAQTVSLGHLTWIECVVDNIVEETPKILENLGINMDPSILLSGYVSNYEDNGDTFIPIHYYVNFQKTQKAGQTDRLF